MVAKVLTEALFRIGKNMMVSRFFKRLLSPPPPQDTPSILDWPLPQPAYDEVTAELEDQSEDQEVLSINKGLPEEASAAPSSVTAGRSESQSADLFQELQREVEDARRVPVCSVFTDFWANICLCGRR